MRLLKGTRKHISSNNRSLRDSRISRVSGLYGNGNGGHGAMRASRLSGFESPLALSFASSSSEVIRI